MIEVMRKRYGLDISSEYLGHLILLTILVPYMEDGIAELETTYQKAWDQLPDHIIDAFIEFHGIIT